MYCLLCIAVPGGAERALLLAFGDLGSAVEVVSRFCHILVTISVIDTRKLLLAYGELSDVKEVRWMAL